MDLKQIIFSSYHTTKEMILRSMNLNSTNLDFTSKQPWCYLTSEPLKEGIRHSTREQLPREQVPPSTARVGAHISTLISYPNVSDHIILNRVDDGFVVSVFFSFFEH